MELEEKYSEYTERMEADLERMFDRILLGWFN